MQKGEEKVQVCLEETACKTVPQPHFIPTSTANNARNFPYLGSS